MFNRGNYRPIFRVLSAAPTNDVTTLQVESLLPSQHVDGLVPEVRSLSGAWRCTTADDVVAEGRWVSAASVAGAAGGGTSGAEMSGPFDAIPVGSTCTAAADDPDSFAGDPTLDWRSDGTEVIVEDDPSANTVVVTTALTRGTSIDSPAGEQLVQPTLG